LQCINSIYLFLYVSYIGTMFSEHVCDIEWFSTCEDCGYNGCIDCGVRYRDEHGMDLCEDCLKEEKENGSIETSSESNGLS